MLECPKCGGRINTMLFSVRWILASEKKMKTAVLLLPLFLSPTFLTYSLGL